MKLTYPFKTMKITQSYNGKTSHIYESTGKNYKSYPIDEAGEDSGRDYFFAPCDLIVKRIYGVGNKGTNTIWLESNEPVELANGKKGTITIRLTHPEDDDLKKLKVGQLIKKGKGFVREGKDGNASGNHFHLCINLCKFKELKNNGWIKNNLGAWVTTPNELKPEEAFYIDKSFTKILNDGGLKFKELPKETTTATKPKATKKQKEVLHLPKCALKWRIYKLNVQPKVGNECGYLKPYKFGGLDYDIIRWINKNVCVIKTRDYGEVQIYVAKITGATTKKVDI